MSNTEEYKVCKVRKHQASGMKVGNWSICKFCGIKFKYVTKLVEENAPKI